MQVSVDCAPGSPVASTTDATRLDEMRPRNSPTPPRKIQLAWLNPPNPPPGPPWRPPPCPPRPLAAGADGAPMKYVKPTRGLACTSDGDRSVRSPKSVCTSGLNAGVVGKREPSMRSP